MYLIFLLVTLVIIAIIFWIMYKPKNYKKTQALKQVGKRDKEKMKRVYEKSLQNIGSVIQRIVYSNFNNGYDPDLKEIDVTDIFHWRSGTKPVIIASREFLSICSMVGIHNKICLDNIIYYLEPKTGLLCLSSLLVLPFRKQNNFNITYSSIDKKTKQFQSAFRVKIPRHIMIPEKLGHESEKTLIKLIDMIDKDIILKNVKDCVHNINYIIKKWDNKKMIYKMSPNEFNSCKNIAASIMYNNRHIKSVKSKNMNTKKSQYNKTLQGVVTEVATCRMLGTLVQTNHTYSRTAKTDTFDGTLQNGNTFDVKSVTQPPKHIIVGREKFDNPADIYILAYLYDISNKTSDDVEKYKNPCIEIAGFASVGMFSEFGTSSTFGIQLDKKHLKSLKEVIAIVNKKNV